MTAANETPVKCPVCRGSLYRLFPTREGMIYQCAKCGRALELLHDKTHSEIREVLTVAYPASEGDTYDMEAGEIPMRDVAPARISAMTPRQQLNYALSGDPEDDDTYIDGSDDPE